jgi:hypothetical protein
MHYEYVVAVSCGSRSNARSRVEDWLVLLASSTSLEAERGRPELSALQVSSDAVVASGKRVRLVRAIGGHEGARDPAIVLLEDRSGRRYVSPREHPRRRIALSDAPETCKAETNLTSCPAPGAAPRPFRAVHTREVADSSPAEPNHHQ